MRNIALLTAALLAACDAANHTTTSSSPVLTGDSCALRLDRVSCGADVSGCAWYSNTRPCIVGQPCPAGWCYRPPALDGGTGFDGGISAACACPGAAGDVCTMQIGGPAIQIAPPITCAAIPAGCSLPDHCACLAQGGIERCWASDQVTNFCICDNGIR